MMFLSLAVFSVVSAGLYGESDVVYKNKCDVWRSKVTQEYLDPVPEHKLPPKNYFGHCTKRQMVDFGSSDWRYTEGMPSECFKINFEGFRMRHFNEAGYSMRNLGASILRIFGDRCIEYSWNGKQEQLQEMAQSDQTHQG